MFGDLAGLDHFSLELVSDPAVRQSSNFSIFTPNDIGFYLGMPVVPFFVNEQILPFFILERDRGRAIVEIGVKPVAAFKERCGNLF